MRRRPLTLESGALALALASALAAIAVAQRGTWPLPAIAAAALVPFVEWSNVPSSARRGLPRVGALMLVAVFVVLFFSRPVPVLPSAVGPLLTLPTGALTLLGIAFALAPGVFCPGRTLAPAVIGLFMVAGADPLPSDGEFGRAHLAVFRAAGYGGFAEAYLALAVCGGAGLWIGVLGRWRPAVWALVCLAGALGLAAAGIAGLPLAQPHVEQMIVARISQGATGLSAESRLGEFASLVRSQRRLLDLRAASSPSGWRLRSHVLTHFDGQRWTAPEAATGGRALFPMGLPLPASERLSGLGAWFLVSPRGPRAAGELLIHQHETGDWPLLLPRAVSAVTASLPGLHVDSHDLVQPPRGYAATLYGAQLGGAESGVLAPAERERNLRVSPVLDPRVRALARALGGASPAPRARIDATIRHFASGYSYTLEPGAPGRDPLASFLFETRRGYCEYYATATAVLLRLQGIPARYVKGLRVGPQHERGEGLYVVRESAAHAWVEAWLDDDGWIEVDPTPAAGLGAETPAGPLEVWFERVRAALAEAWARTWGPGALAYWHRLARELAAGLWEWRLLAVAVLLAWGAWKLARRRSKGLLARLGRRRAPSADVPAELLRLLSALEREWRRAGRPRPASRGLREHARTMRVEARRDAPRDAAAAALAEPGEQIVGLYYRARFGGIAPEASELARLRSTFER